MSLKPPINPTSALLEDTGFFPLTDFGVIGDGSTNDRTAIQAALDAANAATGGTVYFPPATYKVNSTLDIGSNTTLEFAPGAVLDLSANASYGLRAEGDEGSQVLLTANAAEGATTLTCAAGGESGISAGDWIRVGSQAFYAGAAGKDELIGEPVEVLSVASGSITLRWPLAGGPYNTADSAFFSKWTLVENVTIKGGTIVHSGASATAEALRFVRVKNVRVRDLVIKSSPQVGIAVSDAIDVVVDGVTGLPGANSASLSWGVSVSCASQDVKIANSTFRDYRHGVNCSGGTTSTRPGISRRVTYQNITTYDTRSVGINCHAGVEQLSIDSCHVYSSGFDQTSGGINCRSGRATIVGNTVRSTASYGIIVSPETTKPVHVTVSGNTIESVANYGIYVAEALPASQNTVVKGIAITGNVVSDTEDFGVYVLGTTGDHLDNVTVSGNQFADIGTYAVQADFVDGLTVTGNGGTGLTSGGVKVDTCTRVTVVGNNLVSSSAGVGVGFSAVNTCSRLNVRSNDLYDFATGVSFPSTCTDSTVLANNTDGCTDPVTLSSGAGHLAQDNGETVSVASAASFVAPSGRVVRVTGNTAMDFIKIPAPGRVVTLSFASNPTINHNTGSVPATFAAIKLAGAANFSASADDSLTLFYNSVTSLWEEAGRAVI